MNPTKTAKTHWLRSIGWRKTAFRRYMAANNLSYSAARRALMRNPF